MWWEERISIKIRPTRLNPCWYRCRVWEKAAEWVYNTELFCKYDSEIVPNQVVRKVQKVWEDDGNEKKRPQSISVQLLENGKVVDTVVLNRDNNWEYTWKNLDGGSVWQVVEAETPEGYTVSVVREGAVFVMTNTFPSEIPPRAASNRHAVVPGSHSDLRRTASRGDWSVYAPQARKRT